MIGAGVWALGLIAYLLIAWRAQRQGLYDLLNDEWAQHVRKRASEAAFWILSACVVISMTLSYFAVDAALLLKINVGVAVSAFFIATVWFDARHESPA
jgi:hypothetical protein